MRFSLEACQAESDGRTTIARQAADEVASTTSSSRGSNFISTVIDATVLSIAVWIGESVSVLLL